MTHDESIMLRIGELLDSMHKSEGEALKRMGVRFLNVFTDGRYVSVKRVQTRDRETFRISVQRMHPSRPKFEWVDFVGYHDEAEAVQVAEGMFGILPGRWNVVQDGELIRHYKEAAP